MADEADEVIHKLPQQPVHMHQLDKSEKAYYNTMGCGAFSTAMALSVYNPRKYGNPSVARYFFERMVKVPFAGGTFEHQNARIARLQGFQAHSYGNGTVHDVMAAIDCGAPAIFLINPGFMGIGQHDVLLVGYSTDQAGKLKALFIDNPAHAENKQQDSRYPGNETILAENVPQKWTGVFTPIFADDAQEADWLERTGRDEPRAGLLGFLGLG